MNLIDAVKSGRSFRRRGQDRYNPGGAPGTMWCLTPDDVTANDWEIKERSVQIVPSEFRDAFWLAYHDCIAATWRQGSPEPRGVFEPEIPIRNFYESLRALIFRRGPVDAEKTNDQPSST